jgi:hypothetical protein
LRVLPNTQNIQTYKNKNTQTQTHVCSCNCGLWAIMNSRWCAAGLRLDRSSSNKQANKQESAKKYLRRKAKVALGCPWTRGAAWRSVSTRGTPQHAARAHTVTGNRCIRRNTTTPHIHTQYTCYSYTHVHIHMHIFKSTARN